MNVKKAVKKITAISAGVLLLGSALTGAVAANLQDFPAPFVTSGGQGDVQFVIGSGSTDDYLGALDIAITLQAKAVSSSTVNVPGAGTSVTVEGGVRLDEPGTPLLLGADINDVKTSALTRADMPDLLADGSYKRGSVTYSYIQELTIESGASIEFGKDASSDLRDPVLHLDTSSGALWTYTVSSSGTTMNLVKGQQTDDNIVLNLLGQRYTVDPELTNSSNSIILYGAEDTTLLRLNQPQTVSVDGKSHVIEIVGANSDGGNSGTVIISVNGNHRTVEQGKSYNINGLEIFVDDVFITNIPALDASAVVFVGSEKLEILSSGPVRLNGESMSGVEATIVRSGNEAVDSIEFMFTPSQLRGNSRIEYALVGNSVVDPVFGAFEVRFDGAGLALDSSAKSHMKMEASGRNLELTFTNSEETVFSRFTPYYLSGSNVIWKYDESDRGFAPLTLAATDGTPSASVVSNVKEQRIFTLNQGTSNVRTRAYEVITISEDSSNARYVTLREVGTGTERDYRLNQDILPGVTVSAIQITGNRHFNLTFADVNVTNSAEVEAAFQTMYTQGGKNSFVLEDPTGGDATVMVYETTDTDTAGIEEEFEFTIEEYSGSGSTRIAVVAEDSYESDDDNKVQYLLSPFGTYIRSDLDESRFAELFLPKDRSQEAQYNVFVAPTGAQVTSSGSTGGSVATQTVNQMAIGVAIKDTDVNLANPRHNLIVVGGTCINSVAAELKGVAAGTCGTASGLNPNEAIVELFDLDNGKVAMLVAGWEATETTAAARAVAAQDRRLTGTSAKLTVSSANAYTIQ